MQQQHKRGFWYGFNIAAIILAALFICGLPLLRAAASLVLNVDMYLAQQEITPAYVPTSFAVAVRNEYQEPLNAVEFELTYNPDEVLIMSITPSTTLCEERFIITNEINTASGTALFQCGTITPFSDTMGAIATVYALPLKSGTTTISFGETTHVLAHDGFGTNKTRERIPLTLTSL